MCMLCAIPFIGAPSGSKDLAASAEIGDCSHVETTHISDGFCIVVMASGSCNPQQYSSNPISIAVQPTKGQ